MRKLKIDTSKNNLVYGNCKDWLPYIPKESIDLIYIDPPFFSNKNYEIIWGNGHEVRTFEDRWEGGIEHYIDWMRSKIQEAYRVLKDTGSILLHCDWHASHRLRCLLDEIFGVGGTNPIKEGFRNEIIWHYFMGGKPKKYYSNKHDTLYWYSKSKDWTFNYETKERMLPKKPSLVSHKKIIERNGVYFSEVGCDDVFDISGVFNFSDEYIGYKTQKPEKLLNQLVRQLSNEGDVILDFFGGGGTTAKVAYDLKRKFITGDVSPVAFRVMLNRLKKKSGCTPHLVNPPLIRRQWLKMNDAEFEEMICMFMGWQHNPTSKPVDGWADKNRQIPVEIKNHNTAIGAPAVKKFSGDMMEAGWKKGIFVAWKFAPGCHEYAAKLKNSGKQDITLKYAHEIIGDLVLTDKEKAEYDAYYQERVKGSYLDESEDPKLDDAS